MKDNGFRQAMSERSDSQLVDIVRNRRNEYNEKALLDAENIIKERGLDPNAFSNNETYVKETLKAKTKEQEIAEGKQQMTKGILWFAGGLLVSQISYSIADKTGGIYILTYGAIIYGVLQFIRGYLKSKDQ